DLNDVLWQISGRLDLAPATVTLAGVEARLVNAHDRDLRLAKLLQGAGDRYAFCIIDCPPGIGLLTFNALRAAGEIIIPVDTGYFALKGSVKQVQTLEVMTERCGHRVNFHLLPNMVDVRQRISRQILQEMQNHFGERVLPTAIHYNAGLREAASFGQPICEYDASSRGAEDFAALAKHLLTLAPPVPEPAVSRPASEVVPAESSVFAGQVELATAAVAGPATQTATAVAFAPVTRLSSGDANGNGNGNGNGHAAINGSRTEDAGRRASISANGGGTGGTGGRVADLLERARALSQRTSVMQESLARDSDVSRLTPSSQQSRLPSNLAQKLERFYGARVTGQGVLFVQPMGDARQIAIAGDFNDWSPVATPMRPNRRLNLWEACVPLPAGRYRYRLVIDGTWTYDHHNDRVETNPYGELNNILNVA
ncbi:MAG: AAA family ATPase, partial [Phycisphaeraceae bacterium]